METPRLFEPQEANRMLNHVGPLVARIAELTAALPDLEDRLGVARYRAMRSDGEEGQDAELGAHSRALEDAQRELVQTAGRLRELGVVLKDARVGLIDFPSLREGEVIELCWRLGEARVDHWHRVGEGFAGRKPL